MVMDPVGRVNPAGIGAKYLSKSGNYTVSTADRGAIIDCSATLTLALPTVASAGSGFSFVVRNGSTGIVTIDPNGSETINGSLTATEDTPRAWWLVVCTGTVWVSRLIGPAAIDIRDFGAVGDNSTDCTTAIQAALDASSANKNSVVLIPEGRWKVTSALTATGGTPIIGVGSMSSTEQVGATLIVAHTGNGIVFDGTNGVDAQVVGGGVQNLYIQKSNTFSGGDAIKVNGISDLRRQGEMIFRNILVAVSGTGMWARALHVDGSALTTAGAKGVRSILLEKVRATGCSTNNEYILLNQVTHVYSIGVQVDTGGGSGTAGMTIKGESTNVDLGLVCNGNCIIDSASTVTALTLRGHIDTLNINASNTTGVSVAEITTAVTNLSNTFCVLSQSSLTHPGLVTSKKSAAAGIALDNNSATGNFTLSLSPANLTASRRITFPDVDGTVPLLGAANTFTAVNTVLGLQTTTDSGNNTWTMLPTDAYSVAQFNRIIFNPKYNSGGSTTAVCGIDFARTSTGDNTYVGVVKLLARDTSGSLSEVARARMPTAAGDTGLMVYDLNTTTLKQVTVGANDSGGAGFKLLRITN